MLPEVIGV